MQFKHDVNSIVSSVVLTIHFISGKTSKIEQTKVRYAIEDLIAVTEKVKLVGINIIYSNKEHKRVHCDSKEKAISWLNLNNTKE